MDILSFGIMEAIQVQKLYKAFSFCINIVDEFGYDSYCDSSPSTAKEWLFQAKDE